MKHVQRSSMESRIFRLKVHFEPVDGRTQYIFNFRSGSSEKYMGMAIIKNLPRFLQRIKAENTSESRPAQPNETVLSSVYCY